MSFAFTPHFAFPALFVVLLGFVAAGCVAEVKGFNEEPPADEVCGGAVCFAPTDVSVKHWGDGEVTVQAFRAEDLGCVPPSQGDVPRAGSSIELTLHHPKPGARLPVVSHQEAQDAEADAAYATARVVRISTADGRVRALADEETVQGTATILDIDAPSGRVRVRLDAKWSSGVSGELLLDVPGPHACPAGA